MALVEGFPHHGCGVSRLPSASCRTNGILLAGSSHFFQLLKALFSTRLAIIASSLGFGLIAESCTNISNGEATFMCGNFCTLVKYVKPSSPYFSAPNISSLLMPTKSIAMVASKGKLSHNSSFSGAMLVISSYACRLGTFVNENA